MTSGFTGSTVPMRLLASRPGRIAKLIVRLELALLFGIGLSLTVGWYAAMLWVGYRVFLWMAGGL